MESFKNGDLKISVRNLVEFILRSGDIDNRRTTSVDNDAMQEGGRLHRKIQGRMGSDYSAEVPLSVTMPFSNFTITVEGRADGIISGEKGNAVDEIKCVYRKLSSIREPVPVHKAQAMCYGYMYCIRKELSVIDIQLTYCNIETEEILRFRETYTFVQLEKWFEDLICQYYQWAKYLFDTKKQRKESIQGLEFPFPYRNGQRDLVVSVYRSVRQQRELFIQAPTGIGKTMSVIFPAVKAIGEGTGERIFYLTAKTITRTVAGEAFEILREKGLKFKTVVITAKEKLCVMEEVECNPVGCARAKGHYDRVNEAIYELITHEENITREKIEEYAARYQVCPFEFCLDVSNWVDGIICDYNYVFDPTVRLKRYFGEGGENDSIFLVDEAHNLVDRAREMYSAVLYRERFTEMKDQMTLLSNRLYQGVVRCEEDMISYKRQCEDSMVMDEAMISTFILHLTRLYGDLDRYLQEHMEFDGRKQVLEFYFEVSNFLNIYDRVDEYYRMYCNFDEKGFMLKLFCINPSRNLQECMQRGVSTIFFSATFLPILYYKELLSGNLDDYAIYVNSPFEEEKRKILVANDISSRYTMRGSSLYHRYASYIKQIYSAKRGNYMVFFPSYRFMEEVYYELTDGQEKQQDTLVGQITFMMQKVSMNEEEREEFIHAFEKEKGKEEKTLVAFCVLGGIFSEGIDLTNDRLIGSIIVGTGFPQICTEREILKDYFNQMGRNGFNYAYRYPGMNKVLQAAGRVIRTTEDTGVIVLLDQRFLEGEYQMLFPREWNHFEITGIDTVNGQAKEFWENMTNF